MKRFVLIALILTMLYSCKNKTKEIGFNESTSKTESDTSIETAEAYFNPYFLASFLEESEIEYYPFLFKNVSDISMANYYVKNGRLPNNISEKFTFLFSKHHKLLKSSHFSELTYSQPFSDFEFHYNSKGDINKMYLVEYMSMLNQPPFEYRIDSTSTVIIKQITATKNDSIYILPSTDQPKMSYLRSNGKTLFFHLYEPIGTPVNELKSVVDNQKERLSLNDSTLFLITYTDENLPMETHEMDVNFKFGYKTQTWQYNKNLYPIAYNEFRNGSQIKHLEIQYGKDGIPNYFILNKKEFSTFYKAEDKD